jgi:elongation factor G
MHAANREPIDSAEAGDIVAAVGLKDTHTGDTLCDENKPITLESVDFPDTVISMSIEPKSKGDRDRLGQVLSVLAKEDPTFQYYTDEETQETIIAGMGELHLEVLRHRIIRDFKVAAECGKPRVAYRQTLARAKKVEAKHVKQTGGHGQFAVARVEFTPTPATQDVEFIDDVKGGSIPREYIPSVEKGIMAQCEKGAQYPFPFVGFKASLYDGKSHDVDSSDMAFQEAGRLAFRLAAENNHQFLEPIMKIEVLVPDTNLGDVIGDLNSRRANIEEIADRMHLKVITGKVPIAEMFNYSSRLRGLTAGRGTYSMEPAGYSAGAGLGLRADREGARGAQEEAVAAREGVGEGRCSGRERREAPRPEVVDAPLSARASRAPALRMRELASGGGAAADARGASANTRSR